MESGDRKRLVIALPAFPRLAPVGLKTIYTAAEEALQSPPGKQSLRDVSEDVKTCQHVREI